MGGPQNCVGDPINMGDPPQKNIGRQLGMGRGTFGDVGDLWGSLWGLGGPWGYRRGFRDMRGTFRGMGGPQNGVGDPKNIGDPPKKHRETAGDGKGKVWGDGETFGEMGGVF